MTKKRKATNPPRVKKRRPRGQGGRTPQQQPTKQQQFLSIHNQSLKNSQRDSAEQSRLAQAQEKEFKMDTLKLQRALIEKKLSLL